MTTVLHDPSVAASVAARRSDMAVERSFVTHDGAEIFYRVWPAPTPAGKGRGKAAAAGAVLLFHRGHEHGGRMAHLVDELDMPDFAFYAWDARGHGRSPGQRGFAPSFAAIVHDIDCFVRHIAAEDVVAVEDMAVVAQSVGAVAASAWVHDHAPNLRAMVLASPAFDVKLYVPFAKQGIALMQKLRGTFFVNSYVKARFLTHDPERIASFEADPLITRPIASNVLLDLYETAARVVEDARAIVVPTQVLISGSDWVVRHAPQHRFFVGLGSQIKERHVLDGFFHDTLGEKARAGAVARARAFLLGRFAGPVSPPDLRRADLSGYTRDEKDALETPLPLMSPRGLYWAFSRLAIRIGATLSAGMRIGRDTGFDSGSTLDYVYENEARGATPLGPLVDRTFLDAIGWRGIRQRKLHLEELIGAAIGRLSAAGKPVHVLDVAAGHGRYVLDAVAAAEAAPASIRLRDFSDINVAAGSKLIAERGLEAVATFDQDDAFDGDALAALSPAPSLAIVSGLYELFSDNAMVSRSLGGIARGMEKGGLLVYTNQPWHPQLEMIARSLSSHRGGQAWVMRRRTQAEMDQLVAAAGFRKLDQRTDRWGIFTVALAERV